MPKRRSKKSGGPYDRALAHHLKVARRHWPMVASWRRDGLARALVADAFASGWRASKLLQSRKRGNRK